MNANHPAARARAKPRLNLPRLQPWRELLPDVAAFAGALASAALAAVLVGLIGGCGGGVGTEGTGSFASGPITGYGSIVVNGIHFDEASASVEDDDAQARDRSTLALGVVVQVTGGALTTDANGIQRATASQVRTVRALLGKVTSRNLAASELQVLDQRVLVLADTVIDAAYSSSLAGVPLEAVVEVYGAYDAAAAAWRATRIAPAPVDKANSFSLRGTVSGVNDVAKTVVLNGSTYSYAGVADASAFKEGALIKLELESDTDGDGRWVARGGTSGSGGGGSQDRDRVEMEGLIDRIDSTTRWVVDGTVVDVANARVSGTPRVGAKAELSGALRSGVLVASDAEVSASTSQRTYEFEGRLAAPVDTAASRFTLRSGSRDTVVSYAGGVAYEHGSAAKLVGYTGKLEVKGVFMNGSSVLQATKISFDD